MFETTNQLKIVKVNGPFSSQPCLITKHDPRQQEQMPHYLDRQTAQILVSAYLLLPALAYRIC